MGEKAEQKVSSNGRIVIPKKWREKMKLEDGSLIELDFDKNVIRIKKKKHPLEDCIGLFDGTEFTDEDHKQAKKSLWRI